MASLTPTFSFTGTEVSVNGAEQTSGESSQDFTPILNYTVSNESGTTKTYQVDLTRFTGLPIIYLTTESPVVSKEDYVNGTFHLEGGREHDSVDEMAMKIRGRGNLTWLVHPKKPHQMKLESKRDLFGMLEDKKWLFLAEYSDKTLVRNHLAFALGHRTTLTWTPSGHFAEVFGNGEHDGFYHITAKVEDGSNRVDIGDTGFLLEIDQPDRLDPDDVSFQTHTYLINIKEPGLAYSDPEFAQVRQHINDFETVLFSNAFADPTNGYRAYADVDSFIDCFLVNEIAKNVDAQWYSSIFLHWIPGEKIRMAPVGTLIWASATSITLMPRIPRAGGFVGIPGSIGCLRIPTSRNGSKNATQISTPSAPRSKPTSMHGQDMRACLRQKMTQSGKRSAPICGQTPLFTTPMKRKLSIWLSGWTLGWIG